MRAVRDNPAVDPLQLLRITHDLIESLTAGHGEVITEARLRGATWEQVAMAMNQRVDEVRNEYGSMVEWFATHRPTSLICPGTALPCRSKPRTATLTAIRRGIGALQRAGVDA